MKILVVDDSKAMRAIVKRALSNLDRVAGATIIEAADGKEGFDTVQAEKPDLVLSDWNMPEMTGIEFLQALNDAGVAVTFGFVTSESTPEMHELAKSNGAKFLVSKPFTPESIDQALAGVI
ncbi:response regulator [Egicoccus halophilus]|uniref:Response regulator n=1 Tax=Egicoccus halophilus TaxID=1670830 RepID=A0A8J3AFN4_9ACTN|nr:response regulator [Egicoccus halophilus]GGI08134.1 response regulator [Egicoccus halophilus]